MSSSSLATATATASAISAIVPPPPAVPDTPPPLRLTSAGEPGLSPPGRPVKQQRPDEIDVIAAAAATPPPPRSASLLSGAAPTDADAQALAIADTAAAAASAPTLDDADGQHVDAAQASELTNEALAVSASALAKGAALMSAVEAEDAQASRPLDGVPAGAAVTVLPTKKSSASLKRSAADGDAVDSEAKKQALETHTSSSSDGAAAGTLKHGLELQLPVTSAHSTEC